MANIGSLLSEPSQIEEAFSARTHTNEMIHATRLRRFVEETKSF